MNPAVDALLLAAEPWQAAMTELRRILLDLGLEEGVKWGAPCYMHGGKNIVVVGGFKAYCALMLFNGSLMADPEALLVNPGDPASSGRQLRFTSVAEVLARETFVRSYLREAIHVAASGAKATRAKVESLPLIAELEEHFSRVPELRQAFGALTPGRQRGYHLHFSQAKQSSTRAARIERCTSRILAGKGLDDCVCGLSQRMPACDGSHKSLAYEA